MQQLIILKLDDMVPNGAIAPAPVSPRRQRLVDHLLDRNVKFTFGIICWSLEQGSAAYLNWIKDVQNTGMVEFWLHGYRNRTSREEPGEFEHGTVGEQKAIIDRSLLLAKEALGFEFSTFGAHFSGTTEATELALESTPEIKIWLCAETKPKKFSRLSITKVMDLEIGNFEPNFDAFLAAYHAVGRNEPLLSLQGHPNAWVDGRWDNFVKIIDFLQARDCAFITPMEYLNSLANAEAARSI